MNLSNSATAYRPSRPMLCRYFNTNGYCFYGDHCQFVHAKPSENRTGIRTNGKHDQKSRLLDFKSFFRFLVFQINLGRSFEKNDQVVFVKLSL